MNLKRAYYLQIADNAFILSHRLSAYCSKGPFLEEDLANTNVALDLLGLAESIYIEVAAESQIGTADDLVYKRTEAEFLNCLLVEQDQPDFAYLMLRQFFMDGFHFLFFSELSKSKDPFLRALALKSLKEVTYHLRRSSEWIIRLGDGTAEAKLKTQVAVDYLWPYVNELFEESEADQFALAQGIGPELAELKPHFLQRIREIFYFAKLEVPALKPTLFKGKKGIHSEYLGHMLSDIQYLAVRYPDAIW